MRSLWLGILACAAMLVACGDDGSDFSTRPSDGSSSSRAKSSSSTKSSDSVVGCKTETEDNCEYSELADDRDGQIYKTVKIGGQWWMAQNLNYETDSSFCYKDSAEFCEKYGRLYTWDAVVDVCPDGWHLPSKAEWETLITAVGGQATAGKMLKSTSGGKGSDAFGFSALPAGYRVKGGGYLYAGAHTFFRSSTVSSTEINNGPYSAFLDFNVDYAAGMSSDDYNNYGFSVRCLKD
jgi:uncharacterized protein (TIGR02145 family)